MDTDGGTLRNLTNTPGDDEYPSWSPDGKQIVFTADRSGKDWNRQIYVMDADGANQRNLSDNDFEDWDPAWSPDGKRITFVSSRDGGSEIYAMNADGSKPKTSPIMMLLTMRPLGPLTVGTLPSILGGLGTWKST